MKEFYQHFLETQKSHIHLAAHSHHYWPDVAHQAVNDCWRDACELVDDKWDKFFEKIIPSCQTLLAKILNFSRPSDISFATNTHELVFKLLSTLFEKDHIRILTSDSEFYSFDRQLRRLQEWEKVNSTKITTARGLDEFVQSFIQEINSQDYDFIYFSHVFFNSGYALSSEQIDRIISSVNNSETIICIDGYHCVGALPVDISRWENRIFYLGGGYKYLQAGEGVCFMTLPPNCQLRPLSTGWFSGFDELSGEQPQKVQFAKDGMRFWGSTIEPTGFYRFSYIWKMFFENNITVEKIHQYVQERQKEYLSLLKKTSTLLNSSKLLLEDLNGHGHFFVHEFKSSHEAQEAYNRLKEHKILCDYRNNRLRLGFALYTDKSDIEEFFSRLKTN